MRRRRRARSRPAIRPEIVDQAKLGDEEAVATLYRNHVAVVHGYFRACGVPDPDDLTSEVFVSMLRSLPSFTGGIDDFRSWLMTIAYRRLVDHRRRQQSDKSTPSDRVDIGGILPAETSELRPVAVSPRLIEAFAGLTFAQREVLGLRFIADLSLETVAGITDRPVGAVKSLQHRALASLRTAIPIEEGEEVSNR